MPRKQKVGHAAMLLAAGLGTRMRPLTERLPKPLVDVAGKPLIDHALARLREAGVQKAVVNVHYLADRLEEHLAAVKDLKIEISDERKELLETGGGLVKALPQLGKDPFFVVNTDSLWIEGASPALERLRQSWDGRRMDILLLLASTVNTVGYDSRGDFHLEKDGSIVRRKEREVAPFVFTGIYLVHPRLLKGAPEGKFSMNVLFDKAIATGKLKGVRHDGIWMEVGTPEGIPLAERALSETY